MAYIIFQLRPLGRKAPDAESHKWSSVLSVAGGIEARLSEKVGLAMLIWIAFALLLAGIASLAIFPTFILAGVLIMREFPDSFTTVNIKGRVDFFIYAFLVVFAFIVVISDWGILG
jgi:hypothetical protein